MKKLNRLFFIQGFDKKNNKVIEQLGIIHDYGFLGKSLDEIQIFISINNRKEIEELITLLTYIKPCFKTEENGNKKIKLDNTWRR